MQVELPVSKTKVDLIEKLGYGAREKIKAVMMGSIGVDANERDKATLSGEALRLGKVRAMEICIIKMTDTEGKEIKFTEEWLDVLDQEDGEALYDAIDEIAKAVKK